MYTDKQHLDEVINKSWNYSGKVKTEQDAILNAVLGLGGEAGEVVDLHKKLYYHTFRDGRKEELLSELGDVAYYLLKTLDLYGWTLEDALKDNRDKLKARHAELFEKEG